LNVPRYSNRFGQAYEIPSWLKGLDVYVNWCEDVGPATKLLPTLARESDPDTLIVTADDDMVYKPSMTADLVSHLLAWPHAAYNYAGQMVDETSERSLYGTSVAVRSCDTEAFAFQPFAVDILEAFLGAIYRRSFFDDSINRIEQECWSTDDIHISQHLAQKGIPRIKLIQKPEDRAEPSEADAITPLRSGNVFGEKANDRCAEKHLQKFKSMWLTRPQPCPVGFQALNTTSKGASNMIYPVAKSSSFHSDSGVCALNRPDIEHHARGLFQGQFMNAGSALVDPSRNFELVIANGRICSRSRLHGQVAQCLNPTEKSNQTHKQKVFFIFQSDGNLCVYNGGSPTSNAGVIRCWSDGQAACRNGGCVLELCDDQVLRIWTGFQAIVLPWINDDINSKTNPTSSKCHYSNSLSGYFRIEQLLEKGWSLPAQVLLTSPQHSTLAFVHTSGSLCTGKLSASEPDSLQICACYPEANLQSTRYQPPANANHLIVFNPDGKLCAYNGFEQMITWKVNSQRAVWCKEVPECASQPCMLEIAADGGMAIRSVIGRTTMLVAKGNCITDSHALK